MQSLLAKKAMCKRQDVWLWKRVTLLIYIANLYG